MPGILMSRNTRSGASRSIMRTRVFAGGRLNDVVALVFQNHPQRVADARFVVNDQDPRFQRGSVRTV